VTPRWAQKLEAEDQPAQDVFSAHYRLRGYFAACWLLAAVGVAGGQWAVRATTHARLASSPAAILTVGGLSILCLFALWHVARQWGAKAAGALVFVVPGFFGSLTFSLLLALD
jgi:uncharacterized membrane protein YqjE